VGAVSSLTTTLEEPEIKRGGGQGDLELEWLKKWGGNNKVFYTELKTEKGSEQRSPEFGVPRKQ